MKFRKCAVQKILLLIFLLARMEVVRTRTIIRVGVVQNEWIKIGDIGFNYSEIRRCDRVLSSSYTHFSRFFVVSTFRLHGRLINLAQIGANLL